MNSPNTFTAAATTIGLVLASHFAGTAYAISVWAVPALALPRAKNTSTKTPRQASASPSHLVRQWRDIYVKGKVFGPIVSLISAASWLYAASTFGSQTYARYLHIAGALLFMSIGPYTLIIMARTNNELWRRAQATDAGEELDESKLSVKQARSIEDYPSQDLLSWWSALNMGRSLLPIAAAACVVYGSLV